MSGPEMKIRVSGLDLRYGAFHALKKVDLGVERNKITALIGPSGCGKSSLLRCLNRMNDLVPGAPSGGDGCYGGDGYSHAFRFDAIYAAGLRCQEDLINDVVCATECYGPDDQLPAGL